jgi:hypothetical protein
VFVCVQTAFGSWRSLSRSFLLKTISAAEQCHDHPSFGLDVVAVKLM